MQTAYYNCRDCGSEFEMLVDENPVCIMCDSQEVIERKNAAMNCNTCCDGCNVKDECHDWKRRNP